MSSDMLTAFTDALDVAGGHIDSIGAEFVLLGIAIYASTMGDDVKDKYMLHYWLTFTAGFGGGATSALVLMRPDEAPINFFSSQIDLMWTIVWWMSNYFPYNIPGRIVRWPPVFEVCKLLLVVGSGGIMCTRVDQVLKFYPSATIAALIVGAIGGCGGKIINDMIRGGYNIATGPDEMRNPGVGPTRSMACCVAYYLLVHLYAILSPPQGKALVVLSLIVHTLVVDLTGVNVLQPFLILFHTILNIPQPQKALSAKPAKPAADSKKTK
eukprot:jgi/Ulvmu1/9129/UM005_0225.1